MALMAEKLTRELLAMFDISEFKIVKIPLKKPTDKLSIYAKYDATECVEVNGEQLDFSWWPHLNDMTDEQYAYISDNIKEAVGKPCHRRSQCAKEAAVLGYGYN